MSAREEERQKKSLSRGLGLAATAIGVGIGATLLYYFSSRSENESPSAQGSTNQEGWQCETARPLAVNDQASKLREQAFRERTWSLEECSICFEVMLKDQELMSLPCTHNFHLQCLMPWLQEKQTCPNCRKSAD